MKCWTGSAGKAPPASRALTLAPIGLDGVEPGISSGEKGDRLNACRARIYDTLSPLLPEDVRMWRKDATRPI